MPPDAVVAEDDGILTVTLQREQKLNAITPEMTAVLWQAVDALADRDDLRCLVITGSGPYFTAGLDIHSPWGTRPGDPATEHRHPGWNFRRNYRSHHLLYDEIEAVEKPVILAAQGHCLGAGLEMAVSCDFRFCSPESTFGLPELALGVVAGSGGTSRLTRLVGPGWGKWLAMAGRRVNAGDALRIGLVHDVLPSETFLADVHAFCRELITIPPEALGVAKLTVDLHADVHDRNVQRHVDRLVISGMRDAPELKGTAWYRGDDDPR